jgi:hypothetical protein
MLSIQEVVSLYKSADVDYSSMDKDELLEVIRVLSARINQELTVNDLVIKLLKDDRLLDLSNTMIADVVKEIIPGSNTTSKSVSSIRSVFNKAVLAEQAKDLDPSLSPRDKALALATLEFDLMDTGMLIKPRQ